MAVGVGNFMMMVGTENGFVVRWNMKTESIESMLHAVRLLFLVLFLAMFLSPLTLLLMVFDCVGEGVTRCV